MADDPIIYKELIKLTAHGINPQAITFNTVSLESDKFVCVKEQQGDGTNLFHIVDVDRRKTDKNKMKADSALHHPTAKVVALKAGRAMQVKNLEMNSVVGSHQMTEDVEFWKWISPSSIALVTSKSVFHWSMQGGKAPEKVFDRAPELNGANIINYRLDSSEKWAVLVALSREADGSMKGHVQLFSIERNASQHIEAHAATFVSFHMPEVNYTANVLCLASMKDGGYLFMRDLNMDQNHYEKKAVQIPFAQNDFPVSMQSSDDFGVIYLLTRLGTMTIYDVQAGEMIFGKRLSQEPIFITAPAGNGFIGVNRAGQVVTCSLNDQTVVSYLISNSNPKLAYFLASRANLPGAEDLYQRRFDGLIGQGKLQEAIQVASTSPAGFLRNQSTIQTFKGYAGQTPDGKPAVLHYFRTLLETTKLNAMESFELASLALQRPNGTAYIKGLLDEDKIEGSERLGDLIRQFDRDLALKVYARGNASEKVIESLIDSGQYENVFKYVEGTNASVNWVQVLRSLIMERKADAAEKLATQLASRDMVEANEVTDLFVSTGMFQAVVAFLLEVLKDDREEQAQLQTRLFEITLSNLPPGITEGLFANNILSHYNKPQIAKLCEAKQLYNRALENYDSLDDVKRVLVTGMAMNRLDQNWLVQYFGTLGPEEALECFDEMLKRNLRQNLQVVVISAKQYVSAIGTDKLMDMFDKYKSAEGMFHFLRGIVGAIEDPDVHFKYIEAAVKTGQFPEVERMTVDSPFYPPERTRDFLKEARLQNQWPFINVCDKHDFVPEMVEYLYNNNQVKYIDAYVTTRSPQKTPFVIGALLDAGDNEDHILNLVQQVGSTCPVKELVDEVESRNRLRLILPWLEARLKEGSEEVFLHNALAKVYIDTNRDPQRFLEENQFYDSETVGIYCEKRDPMLAFTAYRRGKCDERLIRLTNKNSMYRQQAKYLVERKDLELWAYVLEDPENSQKQHVIDQVIQTALPESHDPDEVSVAVKAFMNTNMQDQLLELLEKIIMHGSSTFRTNGNLQNLLIWTAVTNDPERVMGYLHQLNNYDHEKVSQIVFDAAMFEEAFFVYKKAHMNKEAIRVLIENICDFERAQEFADRIENAEIYVILGKAQLQVDDLVDVAINNLIRAGEVGEFVAVVDAVKRVAKHFELLIKYLLLARKKNKDNLIDTEIVYSYAKLKKLAEMEDFLQSQNIAKVQEVGDRCFKEEMYEAAKILFRHINNHAKLASCLIKLADYMGAYEAARRANSIGTWRELTIVCIDVGEYTLAHRSALNLIGAVDQLKDIILHYERHGLFDEVISLLEAGIADDRAQVSLFTELAILYAKYRPEKVMEFIRLSSKKLNHSRVISVCDSNQLWAELRYLHSVSGDHDSAVKVMMRNPVDAWDNVIFKEEITQVTNPELYFQAVSFYMEEEPDMINDLLITLAGKIDAQRVVQEVRRMGHIPLIKQFLENIQRENIRIVNESLNQLYFEEGSYEKLSTSVETYDNFDDITVAQQCEKSTLLEFRRIAARIYRKGRKYKQSIDISKTDRLYQDAMETVAISENEELAEDLLNFFVENGQKECFAACLFTCYHLIKPDVALELGWRYNILDFAMPYLIQFVREYSDKVDSIQRERGEEREDQKAKDEAAEEAEVERSSFSSFQEPISQIVMVGTGNGLQPMMMTGGVIAGPQGPIGFMNTGYGMQGVYY